MCLTVISRVPKRLKFKNGRVTVYKILTKGDSLLESPYYGMKYCSGFTVAKGEPTIFANLIYEGAIHVITSKKAAREKSRNLYFSTVVIVPVTCFKKDFIAEGTKGEACFKQVFISKSDYVKALKAKHKFALIGR